MGKDSAKFLPDPSEDGTAVVLEVEKFSKKETKKSAAAVVVAPDGGYGWFVSPFCYFRHFVISPFCYFCLP